jgi:hypothetical protein
MRIYFFLKFFEEERHARAFLAGRLHLNTLAYFKGLEQLVDDGRADEHEAPIGWHQPGQIGSIELAGVRIDPADLVGPLVVQDVDAEALNVFCLYAGSSPVERVTVETVDAVCEHLRVPECCVSMGRFAVLVANPPAFVRRFRGAAKQAGLECECGPVTYFAPDTFSGNVARPAFTKRQQFAWQREYRFTLDRGTAPGVFDLDIGPLGDIATMTDAARVTEPIVATRLG